MAHDAEVFNEIKKILDGNGNISNSTRDKLILLAITEIHRCLKDIYAASTPEVVLQALETHTKKIEGLEKNNIMLWVKAKPTYAAGLVIIVALLWQVFMPLLRYGLALANVPDEILMLIFQ